MNVEQMITFEIKIFTDYPSFSHGILPAETFVG
jgi:hypothetical protein